ncbi:hypothetical protein Ancab_014724 [Ancistrocladus abbreviatus]
MEGADWAKRCKKSDKLLQSHGKESDAINEKLEVAEEETQYPSDVIKICEETLTKKKKQQVINPSRRVLHKSGVGPIGQAYEVVSGLITAGLLNKVCYSQQLSYSQSGPSSKAHKRASVSRAGGLRAKFLGPRKIFYSGKGSKHSAHV